MKKKMMSAFLAVLTICLVLPGISANASVEEDTDEVKAYMKIYDEESNLIESYDEKEMEQFYLNDTDSIEAYKAYPYAFPPLAKTYNFGSTKFDNNIWVKGGGTFYDLKGIVIYPAKKINKLFIGVYHGSTRARLVEIGGFSMGLSIPLDTPNSSTRFHKIQLRNGDPDNSISISSGSVFYDVK